MAKYYDVNGNEVEAFTPEELEAKKKEAVDEYMKANPDKSAELTKAQKDLEDAQNKIKELGNGGNDQQKARLKADKEEAENKLKEITDKFTGEINSLKETLTSGTKTKLMKALSKGDKDVEAKLDLKFKSLMKSGDYPQTEEGITQAMTEAATIVNGTAPTPGFLDNMSGAGDRGAPQKNQTAQPETDNSKAMRQALGISDKDAAKYGGTDATK